MHFHYNIIKFVLCSVGMDKKAGKIQRLEQQSPSVSSMHNSKITVEEKGSETYGSNKNYLGEFGGLTNSEYLDKSC